MLTVREAGGIAVDGIITQEASHHMHHVSSCDGCTSDLNALEPRAMYTAASGPQCVILRIHLSASGRHPKFNEVSKFCELLCEVQQDARSMPERANNGCLPV